MTNLLMLITGEWRWVIMVSIYVLVTVFIILSGTIINFSDKRGTEQRSWPTLEALKIVWAPPGPYMIFFAIMCAIVMDVGLIEAMLLAKASPVLMPLGWLALGTCIAYTVFFLLLFRSVVQVKPNGLRSMRIFLLIYPFFCSLLTRLVLPLFHCIRMNRLPYNGCQNLLRHQR